VTSADPIEFVRAAHTRAEEIALATTPVPVSGAWRASQDKHDPDDAPLALVQGQDEDDDPERVSYSSGLPIIAHAAKWQDEAEANLRHMALHDPRSVLQRIAGERKTLAECEAAFDWDNWGAASLAKSTIRNLAEAWGWTGETV
jgi:hypothetical protein